MHCLCPLNAVHKLCISFLSILCNRVPQTQGTAVTLAYYLAVLQATSLACFSLVFLWPYQVAYGILIPLPGIEPMHPLHWKQGVLATGLPGKSLAHFNWVFCSGYHKGDIKTWLGLVLSPQDSGEKSNSKLNLLVGRIQVLLTLRLRSPLPGWLGVRVHPELLDAPTLLALWPLPTVNQQYYINPFSASNSDSPISDL